MQSAHIATNLLRAQGAAKASHKMSMPEKANLVAAAHVLADEVLARAELVRVHHVQQPLLAANRWVIEHSKRW
jgi:hypothetical protein